VRATPLPQDDNQEFSVEFVGFIAALEPLRHPKSLVGGWGAENLSIGRNYTNRCMCMQAGQI
jgi:hypothetical protein